MLVVRPGLYRIPYLESIREHYRTILEYHQSPSHQEFMRGLKIPEHLFDSPRYSY